MATRLNKTFLTAFLLILIPQQTVFAVTNSQKLDKILEKIERVERKVNNLRKLNSIVNSLELLSDDVQSMGAAQVTATFCIAQGRALELEGNYAFKFGGEIEVGAGWAEVFSGKLIGELKVPLILPSEVTVAAAGSLGRNLNICVDLPIELGPIDTDLLAELAMGINVKANDFPNRGKFQRRTSRLLNYTKRRVPGIQIRTSAEQTPVNIAAAAEAEGSDDEFDVIDDAVENLLTNGITGDGTLFGVLENNDITNLAASFSSLPETVTSVIADPSQLLDSFSDLSVGGIDNINCDNYRIDSSIRAQKPGIDKLCNRIEGLPDFSNVERVLSGELIGELFAALDTLTFSTVTGNVSNGAQNRFCSTRIGKLPKFNVFCNR